MCLIIVANDLKTDQLIKDMEIAYKRNSDGFGLMYAKNNKLIIDKIIPKNFNDCLNLFNLHKSETNKIALHFRFTTEGVSSLENCHPFISFENENKSIAFMHNGARLPIPLLNKKNSDTYFFNENYLKPLFIKNKNILHSHYFMEQLEGHVESDKLVFLDTKANQFFIINKDKGNFIGKNWYSNSYWKDTPMTYSNFNNYNYINDDYDYDLESYNFQKSNSIVNINSQKQYDLYEPLSAIEVLNLDLPDIDMMIDDYISSDQQELVSELIFELCEKLKAKNNLSIKPVLTEEKKGDLKI